MAQEVGGPGLTPIDPENVTNQTLGLSNRR